MRASGLRSPPQQGAAAVELAIVMVFLLLLVAGIAEFGRAFWYYDALSKATRDGARLVSVSDQTSLASAVGEAQERVVANANSANLRPALNAGQVLVTCLNDSYAAMACTGAGKPRYVRVAISGYAIDIGAMIPFLKPGGGSDSYRGVALSPESTMPYMK